MTRKGTTRSGACGSIWFLAVFLSLVHQDDFILHILIFLNSLNDLAVVSLMFCMISIIYITQKRAQIEFFGRSLSLVGSMGLILHIVIVQNVFQLLPMVTCHE